MTNLMLHISISFFYTSLIKFDLLKHNTIQNCIFLGKNGVIYYTPSFLTTKKNLTNQYKLASTHKRNVSILVFSSTCVY